MKKLVSGLVLAMFAGAAAAGDLSEPRYYESNDYSAQIYYRVDFGGRSGQAQSMGLRFDSVRAEAAGAPSLLQMRFGAQGLDRLAVSGVDLRGMLMSSGQAEGGGMFSAMTMVDWIALGVVGVGAIAVSADLAKGEDASPPGTGGS